MFGLFPPNPFGKHKATLWLVASLVLLVLAVVQLYNLYKMLAAERDRQRSNTEALLSQIKRMQVDSTTMALDAHALRLNLGEFRRYRAEDLAEIKRLGVKVRNLQAAAKHALTVDVPVSAPVRDSIIIRDTVPVYVKTVAMQTPYIRVRGVIENDTLRGSVHLSVTLRQAVWIEYRRKWLFWRKVEAIHQTISSDNPYVEIRYSEYITLQH